MRAFVKWFSSAKGFGFLTPVSSDGVPANDIFVHRSGISPRPGEFRPGLLEGELVEFQRGQDRRGRPCATRVQRLPAQVLRAGIGSDLSGISEAPDRPRTPLAGEG